jgi:hypothetical protein
MQQQRQAQNAVFGASLAEQPLFLQAGMDLAGRSQAQGGQTLGLARDLAGMGQALGGQYLTGAEQMAANQQGLNAGYLGAGQQLATGQQAIGAQGLKSQTELAAGQQQLAQNILGIASQSAPEAQQFNAGQTSKEASELGLAALAQERQAAQAANPQAEAMRQSMGQRIADLTSSQADKEWLNTLLKQGIVRAGSTGIPLTSGVGGAAYGDISLEQKRQRDLQNLQLQQQYINQNQAEVQAAMGQGMSLEQAKQAIEAKNLAQRNAWMGNILQQAGSLGQLASQGQQNVLNATDRFANQTLGTQANLLQASQNLANQDFARQNSLASTAYGLGNQALNSQAGLLQATQNLGQRGIGAEAGLLGNLQQTTFGNLQSLAGMSNQSYGNLMGALQQGQQQQYDYQKALYQGAMQNAASNNSALGSGLGSLGQIAGTVGMMALLA